MLVRAATGAGHARNSTGGLMSIDGSGLGGRIPLYDRQALNPGQRELYDWLMKVAVPWAEDAKFQARTEIGGLIGPFNPALLTPAISSAFLELAVTEQKNTSLSKRCREVIILTVGAVWRPPMSCTPIAPLPGGSASPTTRCKPWPAVDCRRI
jgi:4-carboxymuconolactone decarboxylase